MVGLALASLMFGGLAGYYMTEWLRPFGCYSLYIYQFLIKRRFCILYQLLDEDDYYDEFKANYLEGSGKGTKVLPHYLFVEALKEHEPRAYRNFIVVIAIRNSLKFLVASTVLFIVCFSILENKAFWILPGYLFGYMAFSILIPSPAGKEESAIAIAMHSVAVYAQFYYKQNHPRLAKKYPDKPRFSIKLVETEPQAKENQLTTKGIKGLKQSWYAFGLIISFLAVLNFILNDRPPSIVETVIASLAMVVFIQFCIYYLPLTLFRLCRYIYKLVFKPSEK